MPECGTRAGRRVKGGRSAAGLAVVCSVLWTAGCVSPLPSARRFFYDGQPEQAVAALEKARVAQRDEVLLRMERGAVLQALGRYEDSSRDFIAAADLIEDMETRSVAHGVAGTVADDRALRFRGAPFERTLLHAFTALNHLARGDWDLSAVESRRILQSLDPDRLHGYPEDAYSRYVAGFGFLMIDDPSNAALQFREADARVGTLSIDEAGRFEETPDPDAVEWVLFILHGRSPTGAEVRYRWIPSESPPVVDVYAGERRLGSAHVLADTARLALATAERDAAKRTARALSRIALKETAARALDREDGLLGFLFRVILIDIFEQPDTRRWETMPRWLSVARVPGPPDADTLRLRVRDPRGAVREHEVAGPFPRRRSIRVAVIRLVP